MPFPARFAGTCHNCGKEFTVGASITWSRRHRGRAYHATCEIAESTTDTPEVETDHDQTMPPDATRATTRRARDHSDASAALDILADALGSRITTPLDAAAIRKIVNDALSDARTAAIDEDAVRRLIDAHAAQTVTITVTRPDATTATIDGAHYLMPRLVTLMGAGLHVYLWGPAGSGKTTAAIQAATAIGKAGELDTLDPSTPKSAVMGFRSPTGDHMETAFSRTWAAGTVYVADETDNAPAHVQTLFNSALANHHAPLAWGSVEKGEGFVFVGTGNTPGRPTRAFPDRRPMSAAFMDRLYFLHWPLDPAIECRAAGIPAPRAPRRTGHGTTPAAWVGWVQNIRAWAAEHAPTMQVTPRASLIGLQALALGETCDEVAHALVFRGADPDLVSKALSAIPLPVERAA